VSGDLIGFGEEIMSKMCYVCMVIWRAAIHHVLSL